MEMLGMRAVVLFDVAEEIILELQGKEGMTLRKVENRLRKQGVLDKDEILCGRVEKWGRRRIGKRSRVVCLLAEKKCKV